MIRRLIWLSFGAVLGIAGYRRLTALGRSLSVRSGAPELARFTGDVRDGVQLYMKRHPRQLPPTLEDERARQRMHAPGPGNVSGIDHVKDGQ